MTQLAATSPTRLRIAKLVSDGLGPLPIFVALCAAGVRHSSTWLAGIGWGLLAIFFAALLPYFATWRIRHPADGSLPTKRGRVLYMGLAAVTAAVGILVLRVLGGPGEVIRVTVVTLVALVATAAANSRWRWSNHAAAVSAGTVLLIWEVGSGGAVALGAWVFVLLARLVLGRHNVQELAAGSALGALVSAVVMCAP